jgi:RNA polymerase sigma-70 factor (ECF subfamily)
MDTELVIRARTGDQEAFASLAVATYGRLHRLAQNILGDADRADDAAQQAVVDIWRKLPQLRDAGRFDAWSYRILVRDCYAQARREQRWIPGIDTGRDEDPSAAAAITGVVYRDQLERGFRRLPLDHRAVLVLHLYLGLSLREVAEILEVREGTVHSRLARAKAAMRAALEADARIPDAVASAEKVR